MLLKVKIVSCYLVSATITLFFMAELGAGQPYFIKCILLLMGVILEASKILFILEWAKDTNNKLLVFTSLILISISSFFSFIFTSNMIMLTREDSKIITEKYKIYSDTLKTLKDDKARIIKEKDKILESQENELEGIPKNWISNRQKIKDSYNKIVENKEKDIKKINSDISELNSNKPRKYDYIITKGFNPQIIKDTPIIGGLTKNIKDSTLIQIISILIGMVVEYIGIVSTFKEGKKKKIIKNEYVITSKLTNIEKYLKDINVEKHETIHNVDYEKRDIPDNIIELNNRNKQDSTTQETTIQNTITEYVNSSILLQDYEFIENVCNFLKDYAGQKVPKSELKEKFNLSENQYRKLTEYLNKNKVLVKTGNCFRVKMG